MSTLKMELLKLEDGWRKLGEAAISIDESLMPKTKAMGETFIACANKLREVLAAAREEK